MNRSLICYITGSKYIFAQAYFNKKIEEFGDVELLRKYFITRRAKSLINRGYSVDEIRSNLKIDSPQDNEDILPSDDQRVIDVYNYHAARSSSNKSKSGRTINAAIFNSATDPDVVEFISNIVKRKPKTLTGE